MDQRPAHIVNATWDMAGLLFGLAQRAGLTEIDAWGHYAARTLAALADAVPPQHNLGVALCEGVEPFGPLPVWTAASARTLPPARHLDGLPHGFSERSAEARTPDVRVLRLEGGLLCQFGNAPLVVMPDGREILRAYSSRYAPLVHYAPVDLAAALDGAADIPGPLLVLGDDVRPANFCHWLVDWLPRLALVEGIADLSELYVAVPLLEARYQRDLLALCGIDAAHVVELQPMQTVRARTLIVSSDIARPPHPAFKASAWALRFLRQRLGQAVARTHADAPRGKLYVSRRDALGRRVLNEDGQIEALQRRGFYCTALGGLDLREQIALFLGATEVLATHGAGLAQVVFMAAGGSLLEVFPRSYGTAAYYILAAGSGISYTSAITDDVAANDGSTQHDDVRVDWAQVLERAGR
jgi:hypothetical protein